MWKRIIDDYHITLFMGVMFIIAGLLAGATDVIEVYTGFKVDLFHSMIFLGIFNCCMAVVFILVGARNIEAGEDAAEQQRSSQARQEDAESRIARVEARISALEKKGPSA